jgi:gamma-glutamylcyclotransferase (GGCT)/AIG2-like uncharacterized protein YtfP
MGMWSDGSDGWSSGWAAEPDRMKDFFNSVKYDRQDPIYDEPEILLFVVGTEKKGYKDHHLLGTDAEYLGRYHTKHEELRLFKNTKEAPFVSRGKYSLIGELYRIPGKILRGLDEKYNQHTRSKFDILVEDDAVEEAWLYHIENPVVVNFQASPDPDRIDVGIRIVNETQLEFLV